MRRAAAVAALCLAAATGAVGQDIPPVVVDTLPTALSGEWLFRLGHDPAWASPFRERRNWQHIHVPGAWERQGFPSYNGHAWYRLTLQVASRLAGTDLGFDVGTIGDVDEVFLNGRLIGRTGSFPPTFEKATLARRFYLLPHDAIRYGEQNEVAIHVYNDTRFGGLLGPPPRLDRYESTLRRQVSRDALAFSLTAFLATLALLHLLLFLSHRETVENLSFAGYLLSCGLYFLSYTTWGPALVLGQNAAFRLHLVALLGAVALFPTAVFRLARMQTPLAVVGLQVLLALGVVFGLVWRDESDLYFWVYIAEAAAVGIGVASLWVLATRASHPRRGRVLFAVTFVAISCVAVDILVDIGTLPRFLVGPGELLSPLGVLPLALAFSLALMQSWSERRWGEPGDGSTGLLPRARFVERLSDELERARQDDTPLVVALLRVASADGAGEHDQPSQRATLVLRRLLRQIDVIARHDRDTFAIMLAESDERAATTTMERLRRSVVEAVPTSQVRPRTAAGIAQYRPTRHGRAEELVSEAEAALYAALSEGGERTATAP